MSISTVTDGGNSIPQLVQLVRTLADILVLPLIGTLWQATNKIARLEAHMQDLQVTMLHLSKAIDRGLRGGG